MVTMVPFNDRISSSFGTAVPPIFDLFSLSFALELLGTLAFTRPPPPGPIRASGKASQREGVTRLAKREPLAMLEYLHSFT